MNPSNVSRRTGRILNFFLVVLLLILVRVWYLSVIQYDLHYQESLKPQRRSIIERVERGSIRDRFNIPLAVNKMQYNAAICYCDIRQIPSVIWEKDERGKKKRVMARQDYIKKISNHLAKVLNLDPQFIEDTIQSKACLFPHTPFVLKEDVSEKLYLELKMRERDWPGLKMQRTAKRVYPHGKLACDVIGYMGAIGEQEFLKIASEIEQLKIYLTQHEEGNAPFLPEGFTSPQEVKRRLQDLQQRAYTINDQVGKSGVEAFFDERLRGRVGKKIYEIDIKGNPLRELAGGKAPSPGERLILSLSAELQLEAEKLLAEYEMLQEKRDQADGKRSHPPWQRGGAIVVMDPKTGEILALASYPRFNPNDLVPAQTAEKRKTKRSAIIQWLESEAYVGEIWDGKRPLQREYFKEGEFYLEEKPLTWELYLNTILPKDTQIRRSIDAVSNLATAVHLQEGDLHLPYTDPIANERDKQLFMDLIKMVVKKECFTPSLLEHVKDQSLAEFRLYCQTIARYLEPLKEQAQESFHNCQFKKWREENFHQFLKEKRKKEKAHKRYARPYTEYLDKQETEMFNKFWEKNRWELLYSFILENASSDPMLDSLKNLLAPLENEDRIHYLQALRTFDDLDRPLIGKYPPLRKSNGVQYEKHLASAFYPYTGFGFGRSLAFRQATPMGSIFKLVTSYAALRQQYIRGASDLNPFTIIDDLQWTARPGSNDQVLGYFQDGTPIKRFYRGGRLPRAAYLKVGEIDLVKAIERTSNMYFSILAGDFLKSPETLLNTAIEFGMGSKTGIDLPGEYAGVLPDDIMQNKTGLYSFAIGQHSLVATPLQTAVMISTIANGGKVLKPQILKLAAGKNPDHSPFSLESYPHKEALSRIGIPFPLFTKNLGDVDEGFIDFQEPVVTNTIFLPREIQEKLLEGMDLVTNGEKGTARVSLMRSDYHNKGALSAFKKLHPQILGKTGTAEILYKPTIDAETSATMEKHTQFAAVSFEDDARLNPELVVVVYFRFGSFGRQGAPVVARLIEKWREIKAAH
ncbi:MAG: hypothetical protein JSS30_05320 [Verrucomicrobia bacterium]|nr:hypothetical protein [Verrucomicrobiota bacterium]